MIGYVTLGVADLQRAAKFYDPIAEELGTGRMMDFDTFIAWGTPGGAAGVVTAAGGAYYYYFRRKRIVIGTLPEGGTEQRRCTYSGQVFGH